MYGTVMLHLGKAPWSWWTEKSRKCIPPFSLPSNGRVERGLLNLPGHGPSCLERKSPETLSGRTLASFPARCPSSTRSEVCCFSCFAERSPQVAASSADGASPRKATVVSPGPPPAQKEVVPDGVPLRSWFKLSFVSSGSLHLV